MNQSYPLFTALILTLFSCFENNSNLSYKIKPSNETRGDAGKDTNGWKDICHDWLSDTILANGNFIYYIRFKDKIQIEWGNKSFKRVLSNEYDCNGAPSWIPTIAWHNKEYIGLHYGCGSPCWGLVILPISANASIIERMYDIAIDSVNNRLVYIGGKDYDKIIVEHLSTRKMVTIQHGFDSKGAFLGSFIENAHLSENALTINWVELSNDGKEQKMIRTYQVQL